MPSTSPAKRAVTTASKLVRTPELALQFSRMFLRRRIGLEIDYHLRDGHSAPFTLLHFKLVNACNLRCKMCGQWGESGFHFKQAPSYIRELVPIEALKRTIDEVTPFRPWISISGGEAFLHPHALTLIEYVKSKRLTLTVSTNGLTLDKHGPGIVDSGVDILYVSLDGKGQTHDDIRGLKGAYDKTINGIKSLQAYKRSKRRVKPYVLISAAISKDNAAQFDQIFEAAESVNADGMVCSYGWFQTEESCQEHEKILREQLGTNPITHRGFLGSFNDVDTDVLVDTVKRIDSQNWSFPFAFMPKLSYDEIPRYYREHQNTFTADSRCKCPWSVVEVLPNGDVATCIDLPDYIAGNIRDNSILEIWNNDRYKKFRSVVKECGHLPACTRCSGLVGRGL